MIYVLSGGAKAFAVIGVGYPKGSTCSCTNGTKTLKPKGADGQGFFMIPAAGTWTVTITDGTNTKSASVEITSEGQSEQVALAYNLVIFSEETGLASGYSGLTAQSGYLETGKGAYLSPAIDVTGYDSLIISAQATYVQAAGMSITPGLSDGTSIIASASFSSNTETKTIDISSLSGSFYIHGGGSGGAYGRIYSIELK